MRVPATARVAFGSDQHVLAERRQLMAAQRTAIRRGLAIGGAAHRPPWRGRKALRRHRPILAPSASVPRASALARALVLVGVGVGVGLALARAERERRASAARARPARRSSLRPGEPPAAGVRRVIVEQLDLAIELLERHPGATDRPAIDQRTVHEIRKTLKRLRSLMRLLRAELGPKRYARESTALRDCGRRLAGARDAEVMVGTLDALLERHPEALAASPGVRALRAELIAERERAAAGRDPALRAAIVADLRAVRVRVLAWELRERRRRPAKLLGPGLDRIYREGRRRLRRARRREDPEAAHAWRKSVKDLRYAAETLDRGPTETLDQGSAKAAGRGPAKALDRKSARAPDRGPAKAPDPGPAKRMRRVARRADRIGEMLGEEHDLTLLARAVRKRRGHFAGERRTRRLLLKLIARRRKRLHRRALREGERLYRRRPKRFMRRLRHAL
jgi:CHAD domain-containing protein